MRAKQEPPGEGVENRSSDIGTNSGGILKECLGEYRHFELSFASIRVLRSNASRQSAKLEAALPRRMEAGA
jgi:hypothetical protein